jgi:hypothetical protein
MVWTSPDPRLHYSEKGHSFVVLGPLAGLFLPEIFKQSLMQAAFNPVQKHPVWRNRVVRARHWRSTLPVRLGGLRSGPREAKAQRKVERGAPWLGNNVHQRFRSLAEENLFLRHLETVIADKRIHDSTARKQIAACFEEESLRLQPLPQSLFACLREARRTVRRKLRQSVEKPFTKHHANCWRQA